MKEKPIANDWILFLDHSIQIGNEKIFLVYGIQESKIDFSRALTYTDLSTLLLRIQRKATGEDVKNEIEKLESKIGKIKYAVGDYGSNIKNGLKQLKITHIHDISHAIALIIEKIYKNDPEFMEYTKEMALYRNSISQTSEAAFMPPKPRLKSRFQNIDTTAKWGINILKCLTKKSLGIEKALEKIIWIDKYKGLIQELFNLNQVVCGIQKILKTKGLSEITAKKCAKLLKTLTFDRGKIFSEKIKQYFKDSLDLLPNIKNILCSSDILESAFGKYKNYISNNPMAGVTNLALCLVAFTASFENQEIIEALENTPIQKIIDWSKNEIGQSIFKRRKILFSST
jgi:hypothetical protein